MAKHPANIISIQAIPVGISNGQLVEPIGPVKDVMFLLIIETGGSHHQIISDGKAWWALSSTNSDPYETIKMNAEVSTPNEEWIYMPSRKQVKDAVAGILHD